MLATILRATKGITVDSNARTINQQIINKSLISRIDDTRLNLALSKLFCNGENRTVLVVRLIRLIEDRFMISYASETVEALGNTISRVVR